MKIPFLFAQTHKLLYNTIMATLILFYVNKGFPYRVKCVERLNKHHYDYYFN